jgi:hypothetical protein
MLQIIAYSRLSLHSLVKLQEWVPFLSTEGGVKLNNGGECFAPETERRMKDGNEVS